ncbi:MAG: hypothetical protein LC650_01580 [Actinobacteria bacterium]|nr:hypothetical protein [Actinomycetota bacterium]
MEQISTWVSVLTTTAAAIQVITLALTGWSIATAIGYMGTINKFGITNGKRIAARAILWRAIALAIAVVAMASASVLILLNLNDHTTIAFIWRALSLLTTSIALAVLAGADVYERVALDHVVINPENH